MNCPRSVKINFTYYGSATNDSFQIWWWYSHIAIFSGSCQCIAYSIRHQTHITDFISAIFSDQHRIVGCSGSICSHLITLIDSIQRKQIISFKERRSHYSAEYFRHREITQSVEAAVHADALIFHIAQLEIIVWTQRVGYSAYFVWEYNRSTIYWLIK